MPGDPLARLLDDGLERMGLSLEDGARQALLDYVALLQKWNRTYNLTAVRDPAEMVSRHLLDSLALLPRLEETGGSILDVGTGPGLPGIPLAVALPRRRVILLDSNGKKTRFLFQVQLALKLDNIHIVGERLENYAPEPGISVIVSRAFASLTQFVQLTEPVWRTAEGGISLLAMKGDDPQGEIDALLREGPRDLHVLRRDPVTVPGSDAVRYIIELGRTTTESATQ